jgi:nucleoside-diphosphate-sugar epimerase
MSNDISKLPVVAVLTGGNGWLGKALLNTILNGVEGVPGCNDSYRHGRIRVLVMPGDNVRGINDLSRRLEIVEGDIRNESDCDVLLRDTNEAVVFHTAGVVHPRRVQDFYDINHMGTVNLLKMAQSYKSRRVVVVSSNSPIGCNPVAGHLFDEESPFNPYMHYGRSKMLMEKSIIEIQESGLLETVRIRAPWFYGPFQPARQTLFFKMIRDGNMPIVGTGNNLRSMAYIDNLAQGLLLAAESKVASGKVYWIADERPYTMTEIVNTIESVLEFDFSIICAHKRIRLPWFLSEVGWVTDKVLQTLGVYHQKIHVLSEMNKNIACSIDLAKSELGYRPQIGLRQGMFNSVKWVLNTYGKI